MSHEHNCCDNHDHGKPAKERAVLNKDASGNIQTTLRVAGMDCADEVEALEQVFRPLKGVREVRVNLMGGKVTLSHDESVTPEQLIGAVASTGMKAARDGDDAADLEGAKRMRQISVAVSGVFTGLGLLLEWMKFAPVVADVAFAVAIVAGGWFVVPKAWRALRRFSLDMNVLMTVAVVGALALLTFSPCEGFLPVYVSGVKFGRGGFFLLTAILSVATVGGMIVFTWLTLAGMEKLKLGWLEKYESGVLGGMPCLLGLLIMIFEH